jgi:hypothetical protein
MRGRGPCTRVQVVRSPESPTIGTLAAAYAAREALEVSNDAEHVAVEE